ncbi:hypothetical protein OIU84_005429 [Salix udensis]|uniref:Uncharacterized protein n=1 Tax=Salix udensis TaxID=889485 RepID=A0AAD6JXM4_9ROSI|nr:hypothetical protein OIU84_005429 [Salix udensis]
MRCKQNFKQRNFPVSSSRSTDHHLYLYIYIYGLIGFCLFLFMYLFIYCRLLQGEYLMELECERSDSKYDIFFDESNGLQLTKEEGGDPEQQDSGTSSVGRMSVEENTDRLPAETCELSLSFTPSMSSCTAEERELWPTINDQQREYNSKTNFISIPEFEFGSNHVNLDLTICTGSPVL